MKKRILMGVLSAFALCTFASGTVTAADNEPYPSRPIRMIVPAPAGSANDLLVRRLTDKLSQRLGQPFIIDNRAGAGAIIGTEAVARAAPDGYSLLSANVVHAINGSLKTNASYHPVRDFTPITLIGYTPSVLLVHPSLRISSVTDLITAAKNSKDGMTYATAGVGTAGHLAGELFKGAAKIPLVHLPYKGITTAISDALAGHVPLIFLFGPDAVPAARNGSLIPLAVTATQRSTLLPNVPTFAELGHKDVELSAWYGLLGPANMPAAITERLNKEINAVLADTYFKRQLADMMVEAQGSTPKELETIITQDLIRFTKVTREAGMQSE